MKSETDTITKKMQKSCSGSFWATGDEFICGEGMAVVLDYPPETQVIYAVVSRNKPRHDHYFTLQHNRAAAISWEDDDSYQSLDYDFSAWLFKQKLKGYSYLTIYYKVI